MTENRFRFLKAIAERISPERVAEIRLFPAMRQGHIESAVAVVAVEGLEPDGMERVVPLEVTPGDARPAEGTDSPALVPEALPQDADRLDRCSILIARYRLCIKGPDRGKWEFELMHDADAPLHTVERVVRGVVHRHGEGGDPELLSPAEFQRTLGEPM
jgi:hypothetical protein